MSRINSLNVISLLALSLVALAAGCTEPRSERAGCMSDDQCNGERVCDTSGRCVEPSALADAGADAGPDTSPDASPDIGGSEDVGADSTDTDTCESGLSAAAAIGTAPDPTQSSIAAEPGEVIRLDGTPSEGAIDRYEWSVLEFPYDATHPHLAPDLAPGTTGKASFTAHAIGDYIIELTVYDDTGSPGCDTAQVSAEVRPGGDVFVELVWNTPDDPDQTDDFGADLDLHYKHPDGEWGYEPLDIFWYNPTADWGQRNNPEDDPELIRDDEDGAGPESIEHRRPDDLRYAVGVYYYEDHDFGPSDLTIRVYLDGALAHEIAGETMDGTDTFYEALTIDAANGSVEEDGVHYDGYPPEN